ncbi:MAG: hypothetical protein ACK45Y_01935 [Betaproteobacteria bacterium]
MPASLTSWPTVRRIGGMDEFGEQFHVVAGREITNDRYEVLHIRGP